MSTIDGVHLEVSDGGQEGTSEDEEKRSICTQARVPEVSFARRYAMNTNLIHKWLRYLRFSSSD